jgi:hypothetical protein
MSKLLDISKHIVLGDYENAINRNTEKFLSGDPKYGSEYVYENQKKDATNIINQFRESDVNVISIIKRTKVGMDGLMIEIAKNITSHEDNDFVLHRKNVLFITGMSNVSWEDDFKEKMPNCFVDNVYHHGKLHRLKLKLKGLKNALIINDEIDTGDKENQRLHLLLKDSGFLDINYMKENNVRFIFVSATMKNELHNLCHWGKHHSVFKMSIPESYISHKDFLEMGIIQEYYPILSSDHAEKWINEDIIINYGKDFRVHLIRADDDSTLLIKKGCLKYGVNFKCHNYEDRIEADELNSIFCNPISNHIVIAIKGFFRRANLIPNLWKLRIGATHEKYAESGDTNVQVQGLPGRMTGYWKSDIIAGHKTGPYRTSIEAIYQYENFYENPLDTEIEYKSSYLSKKTFLHKHNILNLLPTDPIQESKKRIPVIVDFINEDIFKLKTRISKIKYVKDELADKEEYKSLLNFINCKDNICSRIYEPKTANLYKVNISDLIDAAQNKIPFNLDCQLKKHEKNNWQMYVDNKQKKLCFIISNDNESY